jgi:hypothetical protein
VAEYKHCCDEGNIIPYLPAIDIKVDALGNDGGNTLYFKGKEV